MNWKYKAILQAILSLIPFGENINHQLQKIYHSSQDFVIDRALNDGIRTIQSLRAIGSLNIAKAKIVEIGTGWQPTIPILFSYLGAEVIYSFDHVCHLRLKLVKDSVLHFNKKSSILTKSLELNEEEVKARWERVKLNSDLTTLLRSLRIEYKAPANGAQTKLSGNSIDLFFSNKVLEHTSEVDILGITKEAMRILKPGFFYYNYIGMLDHYSYFDKRISQVNFLKYPEFFWKILAKNKISYQNRLRKPDYIKIIKDCGFEILQVNTTTYKSDMEALKTLKLSRKFKNMVPEDLTASFAEIIARKPTN